MRESVAVALVSGNLEQKDYSVSAIDKIGALAHADRLGSMLWRLKYIWHPLQRGRYEVRPYTQTMTLLVERATKLACRQNWTMAQKKMLANLCDQVIREWLGGKCPKCLGRGFLPAKNEEGKRVTKLCQAKTCDKGDRVWSQSERAKSIGVARQHYAMYWDDKLRDVMQIVLDADASAARTVKRRMG